MTDTCIRCGQSHAAESAHRVGPTQHHAWCLEACPFCGDDNAVFVPPWTTSRGGVTWATWVTCGSCGAEGPARETADDAVRLWNTRRLREEDAR